MPRKLSIQEEQARAKQVAKERERRQKAVEIERQERIFEKEQAKLAKLKEKENLKKQKAKELADLKQQKEKLKQQKLQEKRLADKKKAIKSAYCCVGEVPVGKHRGTMAECAQLGEIAYYGQNKADAKQVEKAIEIVESKLPKPKQASADKKIKKYESDLDELKIKVAGLMGKKNKLTKDIAGTTNKKELKLLNKQLDDVEKEIDDVKVKGKNIKDEIAKLKK